MQNIYMNPFDSFLQISKDLNWLTMQDIVIQQKIFNVNCISELTPFPTKSIQYSYDKVTEPQRWTCYIFL